MMHDALQQLVNVVGWDAAFRIIAAWGGVSLYVPDKYNPKHLITRVIGEEAAIKLEMEYGGQSIMVPKVRMQHITLEVNVIKLVAKGFSPSEAAHILGVTKDRVAQIADRHGLLKGSAQKIVRPRGKLNAI